MQRKNEHNIFWRKIIYSFSALIFLGILFVICFYASKAVMKIENNNKVKILEETREKYGKQGLPMGLELEKEPIFIDDEYIYFSDRILKRFQYNKDANAYTADVIKDLMNQIPGQASKYVMLLPSRIAYEPDVVDDTENCLEAIKDIYEQMPDHVVALDADSVLQNHLDEYIYLRTDVDLTSLGAYYLSRLFCEQKGYDAVDIESYFEYRLEGYSGVFNLLEDAKMNEDFYDYITYYLNKEHKNWQTVTVRRKGGYFETFESPAVALSRKGMNIFVAGEYSHSILEGDQENGETLLLIGDGSAKMLAVWLTPYYENIYLISTKRYQGGPEDFLKIFEDYHITDVLITEEAGNFGESVYNGKIKEFTPEK